MRDAAAKLFISQAAVSSALRDFEAELGVSLFDRMGRGIRLNDKGRLLEERLAPLYNQLKNVLALVASDELAGKIRIGALRCPTSCCRKCCTISRCGTIRSKSNVSRGIRRISCAMWNTACLTSGSWKGTSTTSPWKSPPSPRNPL